MEQKIIEFVITTFDTQENYHTEVDFQWISFNNHFEITVEKLLDFFNYSICPLDVYSSLTISPFLTSACHVKPRQ